MIKRTRFLSIYVLLIALVSAIMVGFGAWLTIPTDKTPPSNTPADTSDCFTDSVYYTGALQTPVLNSLGVEIYGDCDEEAYIDYSGETISGLVSGYKTEWQSGTYRTGGAGKSRGGKSFENYDHRQQPLRQYLPYAL